MQNIEFISSAIEQLEKEIWHIVKKVLPELKEEILGSLGGGVKEKLEALTAEVESCKESLAAANERLTSVEGSVETNTTTINNHSSLISNLSSLLNEAVLEVEALKTLTGGLENDVEGLSSSLENTRASVTAIAQTVSTNSDNIASLKTSLSSLSTTLENTRATMTSISQTVTGNYEKLKTVEGDISSLSTTIENTRANLTAISQTVTNNHSSINAINTKLASMESLFNEVKDIPASFGSMQEGFDNLSTTVENTRASMTAISQTTTANYNNIKTLQSDLSTAKGNISALQSSISTLSAKVEGLTTYDLLYDMNSDDPNIHRGFQSGLPGLKTFAFDFNAYKYLRVFAVINNNEGILDLPLQNRIKTDYTILASNLIVTEVAFMKVSIVPQTAKVQPTYTAIFTWDKDTETFKQTYRGVDATKAYIHRVEGYKY